MGKWAMLSLLVPPLSWDPISTQGLSDPENSHRLSSLPAALGKAAHPLSKPAAQRSAAFLHEEPESKYSRPCHLCLSSALGV